ncbi:hypothetical protein T439DRAFT_327518 [Meredithblackwellia eburnea MCA 4105]
MTGSPSLGGLNLKVLSGPLANQQSWTLCIKPVVDLFKAWKKKAVRDQREWAKEMEKYKRRMEKRKKKECEEVEKKNMELKESCEKDDVGSLGRKEKEAGEDDRMAAYERTRQSRNSGSQNRRSKGKEEGGDHSKHQRHRSTSSSRGKASNTYSPVRLRFADDNQYEFFPRPEPSRH